jgi:hypothetical protein
MKKIILTILAAATLLSAPPARAWIYNDGDALLVFRKNGQDVEYDLGSVTNFLGKTNGYTTTVSNWDPTQLTGAVGSFIGAKVVLLATGPTNYLSSPDPNTTAYNIDSQEADTLHGVVSAIGTTPLYPLAIPSNSPNAYVIDTGGDFKASSYDSVVSGGQFNGIAQLGGNAPFTVEQVLPASLDFWQIQSSSVYPNPPPDNLIGVFTVATNGVITFVAGPRQPQIISVSRSGNVSAVQFTTTIGNIYSVAYTNQLGAATATWPVDATTLVGDGRTDTLNHTNSGDAAEFYRVSAQ